MTTEAQNHANRRNTPKTHRLPNKPPIQPNLPTNYAAIITNKANLLDAQMNVTSFYAADYENIANCSLAENKPNTNPTCRGVASGEAGSNPISRSYLKTRLYGLHVANESGNIVVQDHCEEVCAFRRKLFHR